MSNLSVAKSASVDGPVKGDNGKFGALHVSGSMETDHVLAGELSVQGAVKASYLDVSGDTDIEGTFDIKHGKFKNLTLAIDEATLEDVTAENITVKKGHKPQVLHLSGSSELGDITFESGDGTVMTHGKDVQIKGAVKGTISK